MFIILNKRVVIFLYLFSKNELTLEYNKVRKCGLMEKNKISSSVS